MYGLGDCHDVDVDDYVEHNVIETVLMIVSVVAFMQWITNVV